ncbi:PLP-dependent aminotransferase family protein [Achromobacter spanius]|uniref:MocR-like pyridoxine biosynthesis transcription factor PdxR n=1 Tax=Achromobacter spanius TaxID=217203 RepID=UPI00381D18A7
MPAAILPLSSTLRTSDGIYRSIKEQILYGRLQVGALMPSTRALADDLAISRSTITAVYEQLAAEGYLETQQGRRARVASVGPQRRQRQSRVTQSQVAPVLSAYGTRLAQVGNSALPIKDSGDCIDFLYGALASDDFPTLVWRKAYNRLLVQRQDRLSYADPEGHLALRTALQGYLFRARGLQCDLSQIMIVNGSQQAIDLCGRLLVDPGDRVVVEDPCYGMARRVFEVEGAEIVAVPVDSQGLDTSRLPSLGCKVAYVTPSHQFPLGGVLPIARRKELLAWAKAQRVWIIEDDYDGEFRYGMRPVDPLQSIDSSGSVIYVGTVSKALSPQLRLGYMVLPPALAGVFREAKRLNDRHVSMLDQLVLASIIDDGSYERHVRRGRRLNEQRRGALLQALDRHLSGEVNVDGAASGLHVVIWFPAIPAHAEPDLAEYARKSGVGIRPVSPLYATGSAARSVMAGFVIGYASLSVTQIEEGVRRLAASVNAFREKHVRSVRRAVIQEDCA